MIPKTFRKAGSYYKAEAIAGAFQLNDQGGREMIAIGFSLILLWGIGHGIPAHAQEPREFRADEVKRMELSLLPARKVMAATPHIKIHPDIKIQPERFPGLFSRGDRFPRRDLPKAFRAWVPGATENTIPNYPIHLNESNPRIAYTMLLNPAEGDHTILQRRAMPDGSYGIRPGNGGTWFFQPDSQGGNTLRMIPPHGYQRFAPGGKVKPKGREEK